MKLFGKPKLPEPETPPHPLAVRIYEISSDIEREFWKSGSQVGYAFEVVARCLAEQEERIKRLEDERAKQR